MRKNYALTKHALPAFALSTALTLSFCTLPSAAENSASQENAASAETRTVLADAKENSSTPNNTESAQAQAVLAAAEEQFTDRDLNQSPDLTEAITCTLEDGKDLHLTEEGIYILQGSASDMTVYVEAEDTAKVQLVLDGISITNKDIPCIYVVSADKVFITISTDSSLTVTEAFASDNENADAAVFSNEDLTLNGTGSLTITSSDVGVDTKDDLRITGGSYLINAESKAFEANDSIRISDGSFVLNAGTDGLHAENNHDDSKGYIYISGGTFDIQSGDDGIHGTGFIQIEDGTFSIQAMEGIEATYVQINGGSFDISASDDGINAGRKSGSYPVTIEITGGDLSITMSQGDTDAIDSNGDLIISGGALNISAMSAFDYDGTGTYSGGTLVVNGEEVTELTQSMMGGPGMFQGGRSMPGQGQPQDDNSLPEQNSPQDGNSMPGQNPTQDGNSMPGQNQPQDRPMMPGQNL